MLKIKNIILNQNFNAVLNYCFRVLIFLLLTRHFILNTIGNAYVYLVYLLTKNIDGDDGFAIGIIICLFFPFYILPKICGLFKKLDKLNIFSASMVILMIDILFSCSRALTIQLTPLKFSFDKIDINFFIIWFFFIYRFFNFLTKIFPVPFKQIGYIFSIELLKDIYKSTKKSARCGKILK